MPHPVLLLRDRKARHVIFVAPELTTIAAMIARGDVSNVLPEAERLASLGSASAKAFLAYAEMTGVFGNAPRYPRAELLATESAGSGNLFGHYVLGWVRLAQNRRGEAFQQMFIAAERLFLPAVVDVGRFITADIGVQKADLSQSEKAFLQAHRLGHRGALVFLMKMYATGACGWWRRLLAVVGYPYALARRAIFARRMPFSEKVFAYSSSDVPKVVNAMRT